MNKQSNTGRIMNQTDRVTISDPKFEALRLRCKGYPLKMIAAKMRISEGTANYYVADAIKRVDRARRGEHRLCRNFN